MSDYRPWARRRFYLEQTVPALGGQVIRTRWDTFQVGGLSIRNHPRDEDALIDWVSDHLADVMRRNHDEAFALADKIDRQNPVKLP